MQTVYRSVASFTHLDRDIVADSSDTTAAQGIGCAGPQVALPDRTDA